MSIAGPYELIMAPGSMIIGIILLILGGNWTIDAAVYGARRFGISPLVIGFTVVAFGTSLPELIVSVLANFQESPGIAIGNVLGSNIANILLVIGSTAIFATLTTSAKAVRKDLIMMMGCTVLLTGTLLYGEVGRLAGLAMVVLLAGYVFFQYKMAEAGESAPEDDTEMPGFSSQAAAFGFLILGLIAISAGAEFLVRGAKISAAMIGVPDAVIALSIIALGTSLPELTTSVIAGRKGHTDLILGNIIGSNVFNILMIIGVTALLKPLAQGSFATQLVEFDIWVVLAVSAIFSALLLFYNKITRPIGIVFVSAYILYNIYIYAIYIAG